jgi:hypothetical protein
MTAFALTVAGNTRAAFPDISADEYYETIEKIAKRNFPEKFSNPNREKGSPVSGDSRKPASSGKKTFDSLPPEAKAAYEELTFYTNISKSDYVKGYYKEMEK